MENLSTPQEYKPILVSRRSEFTAWLLTICMVFLLVFFNPAGFILTGSVVLLIMIALSAVAISTGNWVDRHTLIRIDEREVGFTNGITKTSFAWDEIKRVEVLSGQFGDKIFVTGSNDQFKFQPLGTLSMSEKFTQQVGFEHGEQILKTILKQTGFSEASPQKTDTGYYYSRD